MGYVSVACSNPDCGRETTRTEYTEYCPECGHYVLIIPSLQPEKLEPPKPLVNSRIPNEVLAKISQANPLEFDGYELSLIITLLEEKQQSTLEQIVELETENENAKNTKDHVFLCREFDQCTNIMKKIKIDINRQKALIQMHRRETGFYAKPQAETKNVERSL